MIVFLEKRDEFGSNILQRLDFLFAHYTLNFFNTHFNEP